MYIQKKTYYRFLGDTYFNLNSTNFDKESMPIPTKITHDDRSEVHSSLFTLTSLNISFLSYYNRY